VVRARVIEAIDRLAREPAAGRALKGGFSGLRKTRLGYTSDSLLARPYGRWED
jgi:hypothetical protein